MSRPIHGRPDSPRRRWILAAAAGTLYAATIAASLASLHAHRARLRASPATLAATLPEAMRRPRHASAYLVARAADCTGNFEFLDLFDRPPVRDGLALVGAITLGDEPDAAALRHALATHGHDLPVHSASPSLRSALLTVGHRHTPYLVVLDGDGALRFAIGAPESVRQYLALGAALPLLGDSLGALHER